MGDAAESQETEMHDVLSDAFDEAVVDEPTGTVEEVVTKPVAEETGDVVSPVVEGASDTIPAETDQEGHAPQSWGVEEREYWAGLDPKVQAQIDKREKEIGHSLTTTGEARRFHEEFQQTVAPFEHFITAEGASPMQAVGGLLQTAATLQGGSPQQKAQRISELITHYGIDIRTLDSLLAGESPESPENAQLGDMLDQRLAPVNQFMQQQQFAQQQQYQAQQQSVNTELSTFMGAHEFANDVQREMGDLMEMSGRRGESMSLDQAYERALSMRPDIQEVIQQRIAAGNAQQGNQLVAKKAQAAVSVGQGKAGVEAPQKPGNDIRSHLLQAWGDE